MPQAAQQDYFKIVMKNTGYYPDLAKIKHCIEHNTIFDTTIEYPYLVDGIENAVLVVRPLSLTFHDGSDPINYPRGWQIEYAKDGTLYLFYVNDYTQTQFEGLGAIQDAVNDYDIVELHSFTYEGNSYLTGAGHIICVDGKTVKPTVEQGVLVKVEQTEITPPQFPDVLAIDIAWEDVQKLMGLSCGSFEP